MSVRTTSPRRKGGREGGVRTLQSSSRMATLTVPVALPTDPGLQGPCLGRGLEVI